MLSSSKIVSFIATTDPSNSKNFYESILGLEFVEEREHSIVFNSNGVTLQVQKVQDLTPPMFTALGWEVENIEEEIDQLTGKGITFEQYPFLEQDEKGIWTVPDGTKVALFKDPDGNTLSLSQTA